MSYLLIFLSLYTLYKTDKEQIRERERRSKETKRERWSVRKTEREKERYGCGTESERKSEREREKTQKASETDGVRERQRERDRQTGSIGRQAKSDNDSRPHLKTNGVIS